MITPGRLSIAGNMLWYLKFVGHVYLVEKDLVLELGKN